MRSQTKTIFREHMSNKILTTLESGLQELANKYPWLSIKYEYSQTRGVYLVTYIFNEGADSSDFVQDTMVFENEISLLFGTNAPLFCDNQELFNLSENAIIVSPVTANTIELVSLGANEVSWCLSEPFDNSIIANTVYSLAA